MDPAPRIAFAELAERRRDWTAAIARWRDAARRFPADTEVRSRLFEARLHVPEAAAADAATFADRLSSGTTEISHGAMLNHFESLGGEIGGCEFGLLQRHFGIEPLGLLRWTEMSPAELTAALRFRFDGVGDPDNTNLTVFENNIREYIASDKRFGMRMHTFVLESDMDADAMFRQVCRRLQFLTRKLVDDLTTGGKLFVYKYSRRNLTGEELRDLQAAVNAYGDNTLLYVRRAGTDRVPGTAEPVGRGLIVGNIERFQYSAEGVDHGPATRAWVPVCQQAYRIWSQEREPPASPAG